MPITKDRPLTPDEQRGLNMMQDMYGSEARLCFNPSQSDPFSEFTLKTLFGEVWAGPDLSTRDRRLVTLGAISQVGPEDLIESEIIAAITGHELNETQIKEIILQLAFYIGWPRASMFRRAALKAIETSQRANV